MKTILGLMLSSILLAGSANATALADSAAKMSPGTWLLFHNNGQRGFGGGAGELLDACDGFHTILEWTGKAVWDPTSNEFAFLGQGHYACQKYIRYSASQNQWRIEPEPSWTSGIGHAYFNNTINPANGDHYYKKYGGQDVYKRSGATGTWSTLPRNTLVQYWQCCTAMEYFPEMNGLVLINGTEFTAGKGNVYFFNSSTSQWSTLATNLSMSDYSNQIMYNPVHKVVIFGRSTLYKISSSGQVTALKTPGVSLGDGEGGARLTVDPVSGKYLALAGDGLWEYDVTADSWRKTGTPVPSAMSAGYVTFDMVAAPVTTCGVVMWVKWNYGNSKVYLYKHAAGNSSADRILPEGSPDIAVSPNPSRTNVRILFSNPDKNADLSVYDVSGSLIKSSGRLESSFTILDTHQWANGVYFIKANIGRNQYTRRFLVQK